MVTIGIIGAGRIGKVHLESITNHVPNATVKAVADPFMNDSTRAFLESFGVKNIYTDYKQILADPEIDAVLVCSSTDTHAAISVEAIEAGKHVFCEKPVDHSLAKIQAVADGSNSKSASTAASITTLPPCARRTTTAGSATRTSLKSPRATPNRRTPHTSKCRAAFSLT